MHRQIQTFREYMGRTIEYQGRRGGFTGSRLPWISGRLAADTLAGIKELIRWECGK